MKKLTIKDLAPYLPYGLNLLFEDKHQRKMVGLVGRHAYYEFDDEIINSRFVDGNFSCKPILRPLSDLTKEIEHNGEKFIPCHKFNFVLENYKNGIEYSRTLYGEVINGKQVSSLCNIDQHTFDDNGSREIWHLDYHSHCLLFENHFDVFGLIEKDLAININTLK